MNVEKPIIKIDIFPVATADNNKNKNKKNIFERFGVRVWEFCKEDINRLVFSLKVGLAVLLVSLLILVREPYEVFGTDIIWAILTVAILFEYTVGATFSKGFNRALGSLLAGLIAVVVAQIAIHCGQVAEPAIIGFSIFILGAVTSFLKQWPSLSQYEYGFRVTLFTFCLIIVSGYRMGNPIRTAMERLYSIAIGGVVTLLVNTLIFPNWAGEQLHKELVNRFNSVADSLQECVNKYLSEDGEHQPEFSKTIKDDFSDEPAFKLCRSNVMNASSKLESLANSAKWEPPHGRYMHVFYPWTEYVKVGAVLQHCAYEVMALHGCLHSEIQPPHKLRCAFQSEIHDVTSDAAEVLRALANNINCMKRNLHTTLLKKVHVSTNILQCSIRTRSYHLLTLSDDDHVIDAINNAVNIRKLHDSHDDQLTITTSTNHDLANKRHDRYLLSLTKSDISTQMKTADPVVSSNGSAHYSYHEAMKLKQERRRLYSWPSREVDHKDESLGYNSEVGTNFHVPRMKALECTTSLSLATFTSLLIEFVARLDHLVEAVDELGKLGGFKDDVNEN